MATQPITLPLNLGLAARKSRHRLAPGELSRATGIFYLEGDPTQAHHLGGRTTFGALPANVVDLAVLQFDLGGESDSVVALLSDGRLGFANTEAGVFEVPDQQWSDVGADYLARVHYNDVWYLCDGENQMIAANGGSTTRRCGMYQPPVPEISVAAVGTNLTQRPGSSGGVSGYTLAVNPDAARGTDPNVVTYGIVTGPNWLKPDAIGKVGVLYYGFPASSDPGRKLFVTFMIGEDTTPDSIASIVPANYSLDFRIEVSEDNGQTWRDLVYYGRFEMTQPRVTLQTDITNSSSLVRVRVTSQEYKGREAQWRLFEVKVSSGSSQPAFTTETGMYYGVIEIDENTGRRSPFCVTPLIQLADQNKVTLTFGAKQNSATTSREIYRTHDGGVAPRDLRRIAIKSVLEGTFVDDFTIPKDEPGTITVAAIEVQVLSNTSPSYYPRDTPPPPMAFLTAFGPYLVGLSKLRPRQLAYSYPDMPESWPPNFVVAQFPLDEHDELVAAVKVGDTLVVGASGAMLALDGLPDPIAGYFQNARARKIEGQPGVVGPKAMCPCPRGGQTVAAWVSIYGIHITNGLTATKLSGGLAWETEIPPQFLATACLSWDKRRECLILSVDTDGDGINDAWYLGHLGATHTLPTGEPKWTGPHPGKLAAIASCEIENVPKIFTATGDSAYVYIEDDRSSGIDESLAWDGAGTIPVILHFPSLRDSASRNDISVNIAEIVHGDWGDFAEAVLSWTATNESSNFTETVSKRVDLKGDKGSEVWISRLARKHDIELTIESLTAGGTLDSIVVEIESAGRTGSAQRGA